MENNNMNSEGNNAVRLPIIGGYTIDLRLGQFRRVDHKKPSIDFIDFNSEEGNKVFEKIAKSIDRNNKEQVKLMIDIYNRSVLRSRS